MKNLAITKKDVYEIKKQEETNVEPSHNAEMRKSYTNDTDLSNTYYIETENNDMNDLNDIELKKYEYLCLIYIYLSF
ncbi:replication initiation protein [Staphylococcus aureus]|nr:replication initiation protein [Staphylococcus aureus]MCJ8095315.1 replication initiation protein [Staphylococcus aureus]SGV12427.1 replication initiator A family protein [Staphylococcus aureus]